VRCAAKEKNGWWGATPPMMCVVCNSVDPIIRGWALIYPEQKQNKKSETF
jgi:hypothetical protein